MSTFDRLQHRRDDDHQWAGLMMGDEASPGRVTISICAKGQRDYCLSVYHSHHQGRGAGADSVPGP